jgi:hypothetical protein
MSRYAFETQGERRAAYALRHECASSILLGDHFKADRCGHFKNGQIVQVDV